MTKKIPVPKELFSKCMIVSLFLKWKFYENSFLVDISRYWIRLLTIADVQPFYANMDHSLHRIFGSFQIVLTSAKLFSVNYPHCLLCVVKKNYVILLFSTRVSFQRKIITVFHCHRGNRCFHGLLNSFLTCVSSTILNQQLLLTANEIINNKLKGMRSLDLSLENLIIIRKSERCKW